MLEMLNLHKRSLATLLLAIMAMLMLAGCSSTDEAAQSEDPSSSSCKDACAAAPEMNQDECLIGCEI
jgi:uncharacterized protein YgiB involved in biofilm formation